MTYYDIIKFLRLDNENFYDKVNVAIIWKKFVGSKEDIGKKYVRQFLASIDERAKYTNACVPKMRSL